MIDEIKKFYAKLNHKGKFTAMLAKYFGLSDRYIMFHWFNLWRIPVEYQERTLDLIERVIKIQEQFDKEYKNIFKKK